MFAAMGITLSDNFHPIFGIENSVLMGATGDINALCMEEFRCW